MICGPGIPAGESRSSLVGTIDLAPTIADFTGIDTDKESADPGFDGLSLCPELLDGEDNTRECVLTENEHQHMDWREFLRTATTHDAKLTLPLESTFPEEFGRLSGVGELYILSEDPGEIHNRWDDPDCRSLRDELTELIQSSFQKEIYREPSIGFA